MHQGLSQHNQAIDAVLRAAAIASTQWGIRQHHLQDATWDAQQQRTTRREVFARYELGAGGLVGWYWYSWQGPPGTRQLIQDAQHARKLLEELV